MRRLKDILEYRRAHNSLGEAAFVQAYLAGITTQMVSPAGEVLAFVKDIADKEHVVPPVLWCCHIDTVHDSTNNEISQTVIDDPSIDMMYVPKSSKECLGADDGAGVWLCLEMIDAGVPGTYIFHRGEERGGIGSTGMAEHYKEWLSRFKWAIALDRKSDSSIITYQFGGRCCSNEFATQLGLMLSAHGYLLTPDNTGTFTDTANYTHIIPECTNVSVGYEMQHTASESLDLLFLVTLRDTLVSVFSKGIDLPVVRIPKADSLFDDQYDILPWDADSILDMGFPKLCDYVANAHPEDIADLLYSMAEELKEAHKVSLENLEDPTWVTASSYIEDSQQRFW